MAQNPHAHHRQRMRDRATKNGFEDFADHELLEMLLHQTIPRVDTNPTAHALLEAFGSIKGVLDASISDLCRVNGIGQTSALQLKLTIELLRRYEKDSLERRTIYNTLGGIVRFLFPCFLGKDVETLYMMMLNNRMNLIKCEKISEGTVNCTDSSVRKITELALAHKASNVILAHNHPNGLTTPSSADLEMTDTLNNHLQTLDVTLVEHIVFAERRYMPIMRQHCGRFRCSPYTHRLESRFYDKFYDVEEGNYIIPALFFPELLETTEEEGRLSKGDLLGDRSLC